MHRLHPWRQIGAIHTTTQQFTALQLALLQTAAVATSVGAARWFVAGQASASAPTPYTTLAPWCKDAADPAPCERQLSARLPANQGSAAPWWQCYQRTARACDRPPFISSPTSLSHLQRRHPACSGVGQPQFKLPTRRLITVSRCGDAQSMQNRLTPQPRERPILSAGHPLQPSPSFRFSLHPLYPCCLHSTFFWNLATLPNHGTSYSRELCRTRTIGVLEPNCALVHDC